MTVTNLFKNQPIDVSTLSRENLAVVVRLLLEVLGAEVFEDIDEDGDEIFTIEIEDEE